MSTPTPPSSQRPRSDSSPLPSPSSSPTPISSRPSTPSEGSSTPRRGSIFQSIFDAFSRKPTPKPPTFDQSLLDKIEGAQSQVELLENIMKEMTQNPAIRMSEEVVRTMLTNAKATLAAAQEQISKVEGAEKTNEFQVIAKSTFSLTKLEQRINDAWPHAQRLPPIEEEMTQIPSDPAPIEIPVSPPSLPSPLSSPSPTLSPLQSPLSSPSLSPLQSPSAPPSPSSSRSSTPSSIFSSSSSSSSLVTPVSTPSSSRRSIFGAFTDFFKKEITAHEYEQLNDASLEIDQLERMLARPESDITILENTEQAASDLRKQLESLRSRAVDEKNSEPFISKLDDFEAHLNQLCMRLRGKKNFLKVKEEVEKLTAKPDLFGLSPAEEMLQGKGVDLDKEIVEGPEGAVSEKSPNKTITVPKQFKRDLLRSFHTYSGESLFNRNAENEGSKEYQVCKNLKSQLDRIFGDKASVALMNLGSIVHQGIVGKQTSELFARVPELNYGANAHSEVHYDIRQEEDTGDIIVVATCILAARSKEGLVDYDYNEPVGYIKVISEIRMQKEVLQEDQVIPEKDSAHPLPGVLVQQTYAGVVDAEHINELVDAPDLSHYSTAIINEFMIARNITSKDQLPTLAQQYDFLRWLELREEVQGLFQELNSPQVRNDARKEIQGVLQDRFRQIAQFKHAPDAVLGRTPFFEIFENQKLELLKYSGQI